MKKIKLTIINIFLLIQNLYKGLYLQEIKDKNMDGIKYSGLKKEYLSQFEKLAYSLFPNFKLNWRNRIIYSIFGKRFVIIALNENKKLIGFNFYYFNKRDLIDNTIHEGLIGVENKYQGKGIATNMRLIAKKNFSNSDLYGISSRISQNNFTSLKTAKKLGFVEVEEYFDENKKLKRYYLVCSLRDKQ